MTLQLLREDRLRAPDGASARPAGARWLARWIRTRREFLGLSRRRAVLATLRSARPLTVTLLSDLEIGDRLPALSTLPALGNALVTPSWALSERILLAPRCEQAGFAVEPIDDPFELLARATIDLDAARPIAAFVAADLAANLVRDAELRHRAMTLAGTALVAAGVSALAMQLAHESLETPGSLGRRIESLLTLTEATLLEENLRQAEIWFAHATQDGEELGLPVDVQQRLLITHAELDLARGAGERALRTLLTVAVDRPPASAWLHRRAIDGFTTALTLSGRGRDVPRWQRSLENRSLENRSRQNSSHTDPLSPAPSSSP